MQLTEFNSFTSLILKYADTQPTHLACAFVDKKNKVELTYQELAEKVKCRASLLLEHDLVGQPVALIFPAGIEFVVDFIACLYAGVIAVPLNLARNEKMFERTSDVIVDAGIKAILTTANSSSFLTSSVAGISTDVKELIWLDETNIAKTQRRPLHQVKSDDLAFIQYTSGSTSKPKGVMVSQGNIIANQKAIKEACNHDMGCILGGWLPQFHDMGLVGHLIHPLYLGGTYVTMPAINFVQNPRAWLELISDYKINTSASPNFGFEHCTKFIADTDDLSDINLSSWNVAINGAEPINHKTMQLFSDKFAKCGFDAQSFFPSFGMAETTLFVSGGRFKTGMLVQQLDKASFELGRVNFEVADNIKHIVSCGHISPYFKVDIVDPETTLACAENKIGEIWIRGDSVAQGYWNNTEKTKDDFSAQILGGDGVNCLRTGDMGFIYNNELYVTGRIKEMIIIRGRNIYPYDIEHTCNLDIRASGKTAVVAIDKHGVEAIGAIVEVKAETLMSIDEKIMEQDIKLAVMETHNISIDELKLVKSGSIPRTTSGKLRRGSAKALFCNT
ncbi:MAG: acyl-CoA synthetase (AMP-forming)/AMP-acid ligase II [Moritella dasanensis]|jgi:acyl-CoA synthetase (AMP-forming)/AMP-acid ligase II